MELFAKIVNFSVGVCSDSEYVSENGYILTHSKALLSLYRNQSIDVKRKFVDLVSL